MRLHPVFLSLGLAAATGSAAAGEGTPVPFAFGGPELFPIDMGLSFLRSADLDGDGLNDLVVVNNARSKINLLLHQGTPAGDGSGTPAADRDLNELPPDARFRISSVASEKRISSLVVEDLGGDPLPDLAYYGEPRELVVQINLGTNNWSAPRRYDIADGLLDANALAAGDIDGDKRVDLLLLAEHHIHLLRQQASGGLSEPERIPYTGTIKSIQVLDLDGDGRNDLLMVNWDDPHPFRFRLQNAGGHLGPEIHLPLAAIRSYAAADLDGDHRTELVTIAAKSGRAAVSNFTRSPADPLGPGLADGPFAVLPLPRTDKPRRGTAWIDTDGDGRGDLVTADLEGGRLHVFTQQPDGTLGTARSFPTLSGIVDIQAGDWDGDGHLDLFLLSGDEKQIGRVGVAGGGRLPFPEPVPLEGRPLAMALAEGPTGRPTPLAVLVEREEKRSDSNGKPESVTVRELALVDGSSSGTYRQTLSDGFKGQPSSLTWHDADQDGHPDLIVLTPYERIRILRQLPDPDAERRFEEIEVNPPGGASDRPWLARADVDDDGRPELLLAQRNFVRAVVLDAGDNGGWNLTVRDQINGAHSNSRITAATAVRPDPAQPPALFLLDAERKAVTVCTRNTAGVWEAGRSLPLPVTDFVSLAPVRFGDPGPPNAVAFLGPNAVAWKHLSGDHWELAEADSYETPIRDGYLMDVIPGDLNGDGRKDLVFIEARRAYVDLVTLDPDRHLVPADRWQVFEERTFRQRRTGERPEPREGLVADLTGDGKADLTLLVHDRVLLYPQE